MDPNCTCDRVAFILDCVHKKNVCEYFNMEQAEIVDYTFPLRSGWRIHYIIRNHRRCTLSHLWKCSLLYVLYIVLCCNFTVNKSPFAITVHNTLYFCLYHILLHQHFSFWTCLFKFLLILRQPAPVNSSTLESPYENLRRITNRLHFMYDQVFARIFNLETCTSYVKGLFTRKFRQVLKLGWILSGVRE